MKKFSLLIPIILFTGIMFLLIPVANAQSSMGERIISYDSDIKVNKDSSMEVTEKIKVFCTGSQIKRGVYRDFPTKYRDTHGNRVVVGFDVLEVLRDGKPEPYGVESIVNGKRVKIGDADIFLDTNRVYEYTIKYKTTRQLGFFKDHDELYWNVTGNGWNFVIERASASVTLPDGVPVNKITMEGYTGMMEDKGKDYSAVYDNENRKVRFFSTRELMPHEGLTIVVGFPKGFVTEPSQEEKAGYLLQDNLGYAIGALALVLIFLFYILTWSQVGRDLPRGTIIPLFEPPNEMSPAAVRYVHRMGYDNKAFAAAVINLAVKGYLTISEKKKVYTLKRRNPPKGKENAEMSTDEVLVSENLFAIADEIELKTENHERVSSAIESLKSNLSKKHLNKYFLANTSYFALGVVISVIAFIAMAVVVGLQGGEEAAVSIALGGLFTTVGFIVFLLTAVPGFRSLSSGGGSRSEGCSGIFIGMIFLLMFCGFGIAMLTYRSSAFYGIIFALLAGMNVLFHHLLKAPTREGRKALDKIDGFRMYLSIAEKDRLNILNPPDHTPELFEKYLPYALALDVEQQWAQQFEDVLEAAGRDASGEYSPGWYSGSSFHSLGAGALASSIGHSMSSAISSSSTAPGSSSGGGGGGSSGGGGGGGGGGGW